MTEKSSDLLGLAERVEQATGPEQRGLLQEAWALCNPEPPIAAPGKWTSAWLDWQRKREWFDRLLDAGGPLDAAMSLVPEGSSLHLHLIPGHSTMVEVGIGKKATAATPALALTAACLRAIAKERG